MKECFLIGGNWNTAALEEGMGENVGYFAMPVGPSGVVGGTAALALPWHISSNTEHPDLAAAFIALMMDPDFASELAAVGRVPAQESNVEITGLLAEVAAGAAEVIADDGITLYADWTHRHDVQHPYGQDPGASRWTDRRAAISRRCSS